MVTNLPVKLESRVQSLGGEDPLEKGMATYPSILAWKVPWTEERGGLQSRGSQRVRHDFATKQQQINNVQVIFLLARRKKVAFL